jgi:hypothetical protein
LCCGGHGWQTKVQGIGDFVVLSCCRVRRAPHTDHIRVRVTP